MNYFYRRLSYFFLSSFFFFFFGLSVVEAAIIMRPPNNLGLVGYWSFDEGRGTQASDLSGNGNDGTLLNSPAWIVGKSKSALEFNGTSEGVDILDSLSLSASPELTVSMWINPDYIGGYAGGYATILSKRVGSTVTPYHLFVTNNASVRLNWYSPTDGWRSYDTASGLVVAGEWMHVSITRGSGSIRIFLNGVEVFSGADTVDVTTASQPLRIGGPTSQYSGFPGKIDEVRIYNRALSASEIVALYNNTRSTVVGEVSAGHYSDGLIARYTFDGSTLSEATVKDVAGSNDGTIYGATPTRGIIGQAMGFDGNDYVAIPHSSDFDVTQLTLAMWIKTPIDMNCVSACYRAVFSKQGAVRDYNLYTHSSDGVLVRRMHFSSVPFGSSAFDLPTPFAPETWHHVAVTIDSSGITRYYADGVQFASYQGTSGNANGVYSSWIGRADNYWNGVIDDVRIYNRTLSAEEIKGLAGGAIGTFQSSSSDLLLDLVGWWRFDEGFGSTTLDEISGYNAPITGAVWSEGVGGGSALYFDGTNTDNVNIADISPMPRFTLTARIFNETGGDSRHSILRNFWEVVNGNQVCFWSYQFASTYWRCSAGGSVPSNAWVHLATTWDGSVIRHYVNGQHVWTDSNITTGTSESFTAIAGYSGRNFKGKIDELRIYSRNLSESDIQRLYALGL